MGILFFFVTFIEQFVNGGPSLFYIWYIPVEFWFIVILFSSIYISLEDAIVIPDVFFSSVSYIGESQFVNLRRLYILSLNLIEFMMPILIHGIFYVYNDLIWSSQVSGVSPWQTI